MASRIKHIVEPTTGWLFIAVLFFVLAAAALMGAAAPPVELTGTVQSEQAH